MPPQVRFWRSLISVSIQSVTYLQWRLVNQSTAMKSNLNPTAITMVRDGDPPLGGNERIQSHAHKLPFLEGRLGIISRFLLGFSQSPFCVLLEFSQRKSGQKYLKKLIKGQIPLGIHPVRMRRINRSISTHSNRRPLLLRSQG